jgi:dTDP-4-amino-4,6-dideoxygalactose transaminase
MKFKIGFEMEDMKKLHSFWDRIIESHQWSEGYFTKTFEEKWSQYVNMPSVSFSSWGGAALTALEYYDVKDKVVLCPSNTFMATPLSVIKAGGKVEFVDCNRNDLCMSYQDLVLKVKEYNPVAVWIVHIGGHISFEIESIAAFCRERGIVLLEDCAHAHGASWHGKKAGSWGDAGVYSFYATKTISTGEGGMLVTRNPDLLEYAGKYRNYGKFDYKIQGLNYRMSEFTAAIGCVQVDRLNEIVGWKNHFAEQSLYSRYPNRVRFPDGMVSGYYKYIVFEEINNSTGKVYDQPCHLILNKHDELPNSDWVAKNHWCVPIYYKGE